MLAEEKQQTELYYRESSPLLRADTANALFSFLFVLFSAAYSSPVYRPRARLYTVCRASVTMFSVLEFLFAQFFSLFGDQLGLSSCSWVFLLLRLIFRLWMLDVQVQTTGYGELNALDLIRWIKESCVTEIKYCDKRSWKS
ncbi:hypothetical protein KQX54_009739 [Cotesia glomerata]|uniref:Uncharacterized protein n=1 Tax=Cotesia glomerata TaxID=32391 RepID=A0AAV7J0N8_COTGL|nr:hypothetical protein KQX54_009739 [Cotesia glomerata]